MLRKLVSPFVLLCAMAIPALAHADTFDFTATGSGGGFNGSGSFVASNNSNGSYTINSISGTGITGLIGPGMFNGNDNLLFPTSSSLVDTKGFAFTDTMGDTSFNVDIFSNGAGGYNAFLVDSDGVSETIPVDFTIAATPEPSSLVLLGTGILGAFGVARRRFMKA